MRFAYVMLIGTTIVLTIALFILIGLFVPTASLLWSGMRAQATIVGAQAVTCGGKPSHPGFDYTVQFTDRAGQVHLATLHGCDVTLPNTFSFPIVYLANDPQTIDLPGAVPMRFWVGLFLILFIALLDLPFIGLLIRVWIEQRKRDVEQPRKKRDVEQRIAALTAPDAEVRRSAARALGEIKDACAINPLIAALQDPADGVRASAIEALGNIGDARAIDPLLQMLGTDLDHMAIAALQRVFVQIEDAQAVEDLLAFRQKLANGDLRRGAIAFLLEQVQSSRRWSC